MLIKGQLFQKDFLVSSILPKNKFLFVFGRIEDTKKSFWNKLTWPPSIQQLRGPNFTQFWPPSPPSSSGQLWTFYMIPTLCLLTKRGLSTDSIYYWPPPLSSCWSSYWMTPQIILKFRFSEKTQTFVAINKVKTKRKIVLKLCGLLRIPYARHYNPLLIWNHSQL